MWVKNIHIIIFAIIAIFNSSVSNAQQFIGVSGGYGKGTFTDFAKKQDYDANYHLKNEVAFSSFYETKMDSTNNLRIELQYKLQRADMEIKYNAGHSSFYKNLDYSFHLLNLNLIYSIHIIKKKSFELNFLLGPTFSYNINTVAKGNGWEFYYQTQVDTSGNPVQILTTRNWEKDERNSKDLSKFNIGFDAGLDFLIPLNDRLYFLLQNRYNIFLTNITILKDLRHTSLLTGYINIGLMYKLKNRPTK
ncbi:MAG: outer membrane beta-barrel protein [Bacteroidales bacterium]|nr:outer membrane beta-barrel protein [Bacteroidales bacterium]